MKIVPLSDHVVVRRLPAEEATSGGILLPDSQSASSQWGRVLSVGDGRLLASGRRAALQVSEGDQVLLAPYAGTEVTIDGQEFLIVSEGEVLAVME